MRNTLFWSRIFMMWAIALLVLNVIPNFTPESLTREDSDVFRTDYVQHFLSFLALPVLYYLSGRRTIVDRYLTRTRLIILTGIIFAAMTECLQIFVPGRAFNPVDMILNISGLVAGVIIVFGLNRLKASGKNSGD